MTENTLCFAQTPVFNAVPAESHPSFARVASRENSYPNCRQIEQTVGLVFGVSRDDLRCTSRGRANVALARQVAMYLAHVGYGHSLTRVGHLFQRDRTTVSHACAVVEDKRDDPAFDYVLELLERLVSPNPAMLRPSALQLDGSDHETLKPFKER